MESPNNPAVLLAAAAFAANKHSGQRRKDTQQNPYINHPIQVAEILAQVAKVTETETLAAALLHDTVEDTDASAEEIEHLFGPIVRLLVEELTDDKSLPKAQRKSLQVETAASKSDSAKLIKIADKICNVRDMDQDSPLGWEASRKHQYLEWSLAVVAGCRGISVDLDEVFDLEISRAASRISGPAD